MFFVVLAKVVSATEKGRAEDGAKQSETTRFRDACQAGNVSWNRKPADFRRTKGGKVAVLCVSAHTDIVELPENSVLDRRKVEDMGDVANTDPGLTKVILGRISR